MHPDGSRKEQLMEEVYQSELPKLILTKKFNFLYKDYYNSEILLILYGIKSEQECREMLKNAAELLDYMRQSRILIAGKNSENFPCSEELLGQQLELYRMTNVLLMFPSKQPKKVIIRKLIPFPEYHWQNWPLKEASYYPPLWLNLHNKTLNTFVEQTSARSMVYTDPKGNFQMNGFVARLIMLFAERFNATLEMFYPLKVGNKTHFTIINQLVGENKLDLPMAMLPGMFGDEWRNVSDTYDINEIMLMVPLSETLTMPEIFGALLSLNFFGCYMILGLIFSLIHGLIDYCWSAMKNPWDLLVNPKVWPGVLGQAFATRPKSTKSLKLLYLLIGFYGLYMATEFAANINTYFTRPPQHPQINSYEDLLRSNKKVLINAADAKESEDWLFPYQQSLVFSNNTTYVHEMRRTLNTSFCYYATTASYELVWRQQKYSSHQLFNTPEAMKYFSMLPWGFRLQYNSPYKDALNSLIHRVHSVGLVDAWHGSLFWDMLKTKQVSIRNLNPSEDHKVLNASDLFWVWMIVVIGLSCSSVVFGGELCWRQWMMKKLRK
ncbi:uncharacterized protein [Musca autumnalis]|uniref:uncharacterized protein n=1 Tax=Musca autumnalis TaxID=221902 RepID=UPI003CF2DDB6